MLILLTKQYSDEEDFGSKHINYTSKGNSNSFENIYQKINLESFTKEIIKGFPSIYYLCNLPNNETLFMSIGFSSLSADNHLCIVSDCIKITLIASREFSTILAAEYYEGNIFLIEKKEIFDPDFDKSIWFTTKFYLHKMRMKTRKWSRLSEIPCKNYQYSLLGFFKKIILVSAENCEMIEYDIFTRSFSVLPLELAIGYKLLQKNQNKLYLINLPGNIYESQIADSYSWNIICTNSIEYYSTESIVKAKNKGVLYFIKQDAVYHFNFDATGIKKINNLKM
ncbi:unnamed protein product [Blepharisma stoltei]|uniref:CNH domain-containing protein n=1 Tax=Blepharisma stoltei TaxID=1481888 RepID=A0AAU9K5D5_9CILI|nr:unnamed protein product [Blepharisma stoltei]